MSDKKLRRLRDQASGPATLISEGCKIAGLISGEGNFLINGEVEGECQLKGCVTIAERGLWAGIVRASTVIVAGTVEGDIDASGRVEITSTARITGTVAGEAIAVAEGAVVQGQMNTTGRTEPVEFIEKRESDRKS
ncbi:MAG: polymer-forming cytoskeletal protein [Gammaproteobacteria bacterium]|nr:polymer-forming cytoskeletal protein [Gammaproteobacteria bacterium]